MCATSLACRISAVKEQAEVRCRHGCSFSKRHTAADCWAQSAFCCSMTGPVHRSHANYSMYSLADAMQAPELASTPAEAGEGVRIALGHALRQLGELGLWRSGEPDTCTAGCCCEHDTWRWPTAALAAAAVPKCLHVLWWQISYCSAPCPASCQCHQLQASMARLRFQLHLCRRGVCSSSIVATPLRLQSFARAFGICSPGQNGRG